MQALLGVFAPVCPLSIQTSQHSWFNTCGKTPSTKNRLQCQFLGVECNYITHKKASVSATIDALEADSISAWLRSLLEVFLRVYPPVLNHAALVVQHPWTDPIVPLTSIWFHPKLEVAMLIDNTLTAWTEKYTMRKKVVQHHTPKRQTSSMQDYDLFHEKKSNWYICIAWCVCKSSH